MLKPWVLLLGLGACELAGLDNFYRALTDDLRDRPDKTPQGARRTGVAPGSTRTFPVARSTVGNHVLFQAHLYDEDIGIYLMRARVYDPRTGQFLQRDPIPFVDSVNVYAGMANDPINYRDPTGAIVIAPVLAAAASACVIGGLLSAGIEAVTSWATDKEITASSLGKAAGVGCASSLVGGGAGWLFSAGAKAAKLGTAGASVVGVLGGGAAGGTASRALLGQEITLGTIATDALIAGATWGAIKVGARYISRSAPCRGSVCQTPGKCFVAGTPVLGGAESVVIEAIKVGDRVQTISGLSATWVDATWQVADLELESPRSANGLVKLTVARPAEWFELRGLKQLGAVTYLELHELELEGWATLVRIRGPPEVADGPGRVVIGTIQSVSSDVYTVHFGENIAPLVGTGAHPLLSLDRQNWVALRDLRAGEHLQTATGEVIVQSVAPLPGAHEVFNLTVEGDHEYWVGAVAARAHNIYELDEIAGRYKLLLDAARERAKNASTGGRALVPYAEGPGALGRMARETHLLAGTHPKSVNMSTVAVSEVRLASGARTYYAAGNGGRLNKRQVERLVELGVPRANVLRGAGVSKGFTRLENHAERVILRNLPEGASVQRWGISWAGGQKPIPCPSCAPHVSGAGGFLELPGTAF